MRYLSFASVLLSALMLVACGGKPSGAQPAPTDGNASGDQLPTPTGTAGGVTGMPARPGPGPVGPPSPAATDVPVDENGNPLVPETEAGTATASNATGEPTVDDAVGVVRDYYAAINSGDFTHAYELWADEGRASGKSQPQFAAGFADTTGVSVELAPPGRVDAAAGTRYIQVPATVTATQRDGSQHKYSGNYTLRRAVVDGATAEQRAWRIASADLREVQL